MEPGRRRGRGLGRPAVPARPRPGLRALRRRLLRWAGCWIELLRIDTAETFFGVRLNVFTAVVVGVLAVAYLVWQRGRPREVHRPGARSRAREARRTATRPPGPARGVGATARRRRTPSTARATPLSTAGPAGRRGTPHGVPSAPPPSETFASRAGRVARCRRCVPFGAEPARRSRPGRPRRNRASDAPRTTAQRAPARGLRAARRRAGRHVRRRHAPLHPQCRPHRPPLTTGPGPRPRSASLPEPRTPPTTGVTCPTSPRPPTPAARTPRPARCRSPPSRRPAASTTRPTSTTPAAWPSWPTPGAAGRRSIVAMGLTALHNLDHRGAAGLRAQLRGRRRASSPRSPTRCCAPASTSTCRRRGSTPSASPSCPPTRPSAPPGSPTSPGSPPRRA